MPEEAKCPKCGGSAAKGKVFEYVPGNRCANCGHREVENITEAEYLATQHMLMNLAAVVRTLPLDRFINAINKAETTGPVLDPTLFRAAGRKMDEIKEMARGALAFQRALPALCPQCKKNSVAYRGAVYCGAACSVKAEAGEPAAPDPG
jgi:hypothetical protein